MPRPKSNCKKNCKRSQCKRLSKKSGYKIRCCICSRDSEYCHLHKRLDGPSIATRKPNNSTTVGYGVSVKSSTIQNAGNGLFANIPFASNDIITRYEPNPYDHNKTDLLTRSEAKRIVDQRWIAQKDGNYVAGLQTPIRGLGGGSFANDNNGPYNAELYVHPDRLHHIYLKAKRGVLILPGDEIFISYGTGRHAAMGDVQMR